MRRKAIPIPLPSVFPRQERRPGWGYLHLEVNMKALAGIIMALLLIYGVAEVLLGNAPMAIYSWIILLSVAIGSSAMFRSVERAPEVYDRTATRNRSRTHYTKAEWQTLCTLYGNRCVACGRKRPLTADHVIPFSAGGNDDISNIQPLCQSCNSKKGVKTTDYRTAK